jgi:hypothetical protein
LSSEYAAAAGAVSWEQHNGVAQVRDVSFDEKAVHHIGERTSREMMEKMLLLLAASIPVSSNSTWQTKGNNYQAQLLCLV